MNHQRLDFFRKLDGLIGRTRVKQHDFFGDFSARTTSETMRSSMFSPMRTTRRSGTFTRLVALTEAIKPVLFTKRLVVFHA